MSFVVQDSDDPFSFEGLRRYKTKREAAAYWNIKMREMGATYPEAQ